MKAISRMNRVNILVFNENGDMYAAPRLNMDYVRCIFVAFSGCSDASNSNMGRNHYDSICQIKQDDIFSCVKDLLQMHQKQQSQNERKSIVWID